MKIILEKKHNKNRKKNHVGKNTVTINNNFRGKLQCLLSSHIVTVIFNQLNIKKN